VFEQQALSPISSNFARLGRTVNQKAVQVWAWAVDGVGGPGMNAKALRTDPLLTLRRLRAYFKLDFQYELARHQSNETMMWHGRKYFIKRAQRAPLGEVDKLLMAHFRVNPPPFQVSRFEPALSPYSVAAVEYLPGINGYLFLALVERIVSNSDPAKAERAYRLKKAIIEKVLKDLLAFRGLRDEFLMVSGFIPKPYRYQSKLRSSRDLVTLWLLPTLPTELRLLFEAEVDWIGSYLEAHSSVFFRDMTARNFHMNLPELEGLSDEAVMAVISAALAEEATFERWQQRVLSRLIHIDFSTTNRLASEYDDLIHLLEPPHMALRGTDPLVRDAYGKDIEPDLYDLTMVHRIFRTYTRRTWYAMTHGQDSFRQYTLDPAKYYLAKTKEAIERLRQRHGEQFLMGFHQTLRLLEQSS